MFEIVGCGLFSFLNIDVSFYFHRFTPGARSSSYESGGKENNIYKKKRAKYRKTGAGEVKNSFSFFCGEGSVEKKNPKS